jgi:hypothetical protein
MIKSYCIIGLGDITGITKILAEISETDVAYVSGSGLVIATFATVFKIPEMEDLLKEEEKSYIIFEMTPGFYSAFIKDDNLQEKLFGGIIDNRGLYGNISDSAETIMDILGKKVAGEDYFIKSEEIEPDMDDILDRINEVGYENITKQEKKLLKKYSETK